MKLSELRQCDGCGGPLVKLPNIRFDVVRWSAALVVPSAPNEVLNAAEAMVPDAEVVKLVAGDDGGGWTEIFLCVDCSMSPRLGRLHEMIEGRRDRLDAEFDALRLDDEPSPKVPAP